MTTERAGDRRVDGDGADRVVTLALVGVVLLAITAFGLLTYVAITGGGSGATPAEDVRWELQEINGTHVRIVHDGGPTVSPDGLTVTVDGVERRVRWSDATLSEGDYGVVRTAHGTRVTLHRQRDRVNRVVVGRWTLTETSETGTESG